MTVSSTRTSGASSAYVRAVNLASVLQQVLHRPEISRAGVAAAMGVTRSTVSRLVDDLVAGGFLVEGDPVVGARGRPATPLRPAPRTFVAIGVELNVQRAVGMLVDLTGEVLAEHIIFLDGIALSAEEALAKVDDVIAVLQEQIDADSTLLGAHLAVPALVDREGGTVLRAPNLGWVNVPVKDMGVSNDIDCSALSLLEGTALLKDPDSNFLYVSGEVGVGAAVCIDGSIRGGRHGWANELGHVTVRPDGPPCGCGSNGCLEAYAGLIPLLREARAETLDEVVERLEAGDAHTLATIATVGRALGVALSSALNLLDVSRVLLGGHLAVLHPWFADIVDEELTKRVLWSDLAELEVAPVTESPRRAAYGAAWVVLLDAISDPAPWIDRSVTAPG